MFQELWMKILFCSKQCQSLLFLIALLLTAPWAEAARDFPDFTGMVEQYAPAVVNISTKQTRTIRRGLPPGFRMPDLPDDSPFRDFFRHFFDGQGGTQEFDSTSLGSGFIISDDGYVLTNQHVVDGADEIIVYLSDHREFEANVVGSDKRSDIALLKIDAKGLPVVKIGKSQELKVGEWVLAIGSPFGFDHSVTAGIVSAKGRSLPRENYVPFIQTDVAINPGNSGGPLFNLDGEVVGVNSQIYSRTGGFMGLSFSIPIEVAMNVVEQLKSSGHVARGWLGVVIQDVPRELAGSFGLKHPQGALISQVLEDSPAEKAKLQEGDVILAYNGTEITSSSKLPPLVGASEVDKSADLTILRNRKRINVKVKIGALPEEEPVAMNPSGMAPHSSSNVLGLEVQDLTAKQIESMGSRKGGVLVTQVEPGAASDAGIREGDVIQMINNTPVKNVKEFSGIIHKLPKGKTVAVLVRRGDGARFLALDVPAK
jgi:serine protease Do